VSEQGSGDARVLSPGIGHMCKADSEQSRAAAPIACFTETGITIRRWTCTTPFMARISGAQPLRLVEQGSPCPSIATRHRRGSPAVIGPLQSDDSRLTDPH
jgi:hypothetical protein